jgi:hypothetical protein
MQFVVTASLQSLKLFVKSLLCLHRVSPHLLLVATATDVRRRLASRRTPPRLAHARAQAQFEEKRVSQTFLSPWAAQAVCAQRVGHVLLPNVVCVHLLSLVPSARGEERVHGLAQGERALLPGPTPPPNQRLDSAQACLAVFRSLATIEKCQVRLDRAEQNLVFDLTCLSDAKKVSCARGDCRSPDLDSGSRSAFRSTTAASRVRFRCPSMCRLASPLSPNRCRRANQRAFR